MAKRRRSKRVSLTIEFSAAEFQQVERAAHRLKLSLTDFATRAVLFDAWLNSQDPIDDSAEIAKLIELDQWPPGDGAGV